MCTLAIYFQVFGDFPAIVAANRDEFFDRPAAAPTTLLDQPHVVGGRDLRAGGTWLGINEYGLIAGLLNRQSSQSVSPNWRSRGLLCLDALRYGTGGEAADFVSKQDPDRYNAFNLLIASRAEAFVAHNRRHAIDIVRLQAGLHLLTNLDVDDPECPKISRSYRRFAELGGSLDFARDPLGGREALRAVLADHFTELDPRTKQANSLCLHLEEYGTRSSSLILLSAKGDEIEHYFAPGPPCSAAYELAPVPVHALSSK
jgi:uncharacterized protein with NRDE domain